MVNGAMTFEAQWTRISDTVTFALAGGTYGSDAGPLTRSVYRYTAIGTANVPAPPTLSRTHHAFDGWRHPGMAPEDANLSHADVASFNVTGGITFTAQWTPILHTVTFQLNGGNIADNTNDVTRTVQQGSPLNGVAPNEAMPSGMQLDGHTFSRWEIVTGGTAGDSFTGSTTVPNNMTVRAVWLPQGQGVTFLLNNGRVGTDNYGPISEDVTWGTQIGLNRVPEPVRPGWTFNNWNQTIPTGGGTNLSRTDIGNITVNGAMTFEAQWTRISDTVTFALAGGTYGSDAGPLTRSVYRYTAIGTANVPAPPTLSRTHHAFDGWRHPGMAPEDANLSHADVASFTVSGGITFTAQWRLNYFLEFRFDGDNSNPNARAFDYIRIPVTPGQTFDWTSSVGATYVYAIADEPTTGTFDKTDDALVQGWAFWGWFDNIQTRADGRNRPVVGSIGWDLSSPDFIFHVEDFETLGNGNVIVFTAIWSLWGDANDDDQVDSADVLLINQWLFDGTLANPHFDNPINLGAANVTVPADRIVTSADVLRINQWLFDRTLTIPHFFAVLGRR